MTMLFNPSAHKLQPGQQPQYPVEVDWSNPLTRGLVLAYDAASRTNRALGRTPTLANSSNYLVESYADGKRAIRGVRQAQTGANVVNIKTLPLDMSKGLSFLAIHYCYTQSYRQVFNIENYFLAEQFVGQNSFRFYDDNASAQLLSSNAGMEPAGAVLFQAGAISYGTSAPYYLNTNGTKKTGTVSGSLPSVITNSATIGGGYIESHVHWTLGVIGYVFVFEGVKSDAEIDALVRDPYQIFRPATPMPVFTAAAATGSQIKYWDGASWTLKPLKRWDGSAWQTTTLKRWNGSSWITE